MIWIAGIVAFLAGTALGALLYKVFRSDEARVKALELKLQELSEEYENYKSSVHTHFNGTARLLSELTDSYRSVYQHLAKGAQNLCPDYISSQLSLENLGQPTLPGDSSATPPREVPGDESEPAPPLDYAARSAAEARKKGALDEDYGISPPGGRS